MTVSAWSYSAWAQWKLCPAQYKYERIEKRPTGYVAHFEKGLKVHKSIERYIIAGEPLIDDIKQEREFIEECRAAPFEKTVEEKWGFSRDWSRTGWSGAGVWFRSVIDFMVVYPDAVAEVTDWKTGKKYAANEDQMELFAVAVMKRFNVGAVITRLVYVEAGGHEFGEYDRSQLPSLTAKWEANAAGLFDERDWLPRPNYKCGFCNFSKSKQGPCKYG